MVFSSMDNRDTQWSLSVASYGEVEDTATEVVPS